MTNLATTTATSRASAWCRQASSWDEIADHIKIVHGPLLAGPDANGQYAGAYWAAARMVVEPDLGPDQDEAVSEFRQILRERGQV